jgi:hypothetical protein
MMMSYARIQTGRSFLVGCIRKQTGCSIADGVSTRDESLSDLRKTALASFLKLPFFLE